MARARAIETRLEKLFPSLEEYFTSGFLTRDETRDVARQRTHWEYRLVAKPLLLLDVRNAVAYELGLEKRLQEYCGTTKLVLKHRWAILERIESIYRIGVKHLRDQKESELIRREFVQFLKDHSRHSSLSAFYGELMVRYPTRSSLWVEAALYEGVEMGNTDSGRSIVQQAILTAGAHPEVWNAAFLLELYFVDRLLKKLLEEESQKVQKGHEHDIVQVLQAENAALASVLVELALVKTVVEEAFESPAFGPNLVQLLLESAMRFGYTKPIVEMMMTSAALKMMSALSTADDKCTTTTSHVWSEAGLSRFLRDYLTIEVLMVDGGVTGDVAAYLRSGGRLHAATPAERRAALVKAFAAALTLAVTPIKSTSSVLKRLRKAAVAVVETLLEDLQHSTSVDRVSTVCRRLLSEKCVDVVEAVQCLCQRPDASLLQQLAHAPAERVQTVLQATFGGEPLRTKKKSRHEETSTDTDNITWQIWRFLLPDDRKAVDSHASKPVAHVVTAEDVERLVFSQRNEQDMVAVERAVVRFLKEFTLIKGGDAPEAIQRLRYSKEKTPVALWRVFHLLELRCKATVPSLSTHTSTENVGNTDSDSDDDSDHATEGSKMTDNSYATAGLHFLASVPRGSLTREAEEERLEGCWGLLSARVETLTALRGSTTCADFIGCLQHSHSDAWVAGLRSVFRVARLCEPLPRQALASIVIPFLEALVLERGGDGVVREAREAHEQLLGMYALSRHPADFSPLVHHVPRREGATVRLSPDELNAADWAQFVAFERSVAKDLRRAKETVERAKRMALTPQRLLAILSAY